MNKISTSIIMSVSVSSLRNNMIDSVRDTLGPNLVHYVSSDLGDESWEIRNTLNKLESSKLWSFPIDLGISHVLN